MNAHSNSFSQNASVATMLATLLRLVAPTSMTPEARLQWVQDAVNLMEGIRPDEVAAVHVEVARSVKRHGDIVPRICELVHAKRARSTISRTVSPFFAEHEISRQAQEMRAKARSQREVEDAWQWERGARADAGLAVPPIERPLNSSEISALPSHIVKFGLNSGFLKRDGERVVEVTDPREIDRIREANRRRA